MTATGNSWIDQPAAFALSPPPLLSRAIADALTGKDDADTALAWVHGYPSPLSFQWCCSVLEIEQERARGCFLALIQSPQQFRHLLPVLGRAKGSQSRF